MLNMKCANGLYGCLKCLHPGKSIPYNYGHHVIYDPKKDYPLRNKANYASDLAKCKVLNHEYNGVKGDCVLSQVF